MTSLNSWPPPPLIRGCKALWNFVCLWRKTCYEVLVRSKTNRKSLPDYCTLKAGRVQGCGSADRAKVWPFVPYQRKYRWPYHPPEGEGGSCPSLPSLTSPLSAHMSRIPDLRSGCLPDFSASSLQYERMSVNQVSWSDSVSWCDRDHCWQQSCSNMQIRQS